MRGFAGSSNPFTLSAVSDYATYAENNNSFKGKTVIYSIIHPRAIDRWCLVPFRYRTPRRQRVIDRTVPLRKPLRNYDRIGHPLWLTHHNGSCRHNESYLPVPKRPWLAEAISAPFRRRVQITDRRHASPY